jgi:NitT/TauT family transport system substrate-binding protein
MNTWRTTTRVAATLIGIWLTLPASAQVLTLRYAQSPSTNSSIFSLPIFIAEREGLFARQGLNFSTVLIGGGGETTIHALHDGRADIAHVATPFLIRAALGGSDAVAIAAEFNNPIYSLVAHPAIKSVAELKGKTLGYADEAGTITYSVRRLLGKHGLTDSDFTIKVISGTPQRFDCLIHSDCYAVPLGQPHDMFAIRQGFNLLGRTSEVTPEFVYTVTTARRSWADANRDAVIRYLRALGEAFRIIRDPEKRDVVIRAIADTSNASPEVARQIVALFFEPERGVMPRRGEISLPGLSQVIGFMGETGALKPPLPPAERFADPKYLKAAGIE